MKINKVILNQNYNTVQEVFEAAAGYFKELGIVTDEQEFINALNEREAQSTTGMIDSIAIPHGKGKCVSESAVIYIRNNHGIEWNSLDGSLITDIFVLAISEGATDHLDSLIAISSNLMDDEQRKQLRSLSDLDEIQNIFN